MQLKNTKQNPKTSIQILSTMEQSAILWQIKTLWVWVYKSDAEQGQDLKKRCEKQTRNGHNHVPWKWCSKGENFCENPITFLNFKPLHTRI